MPYLQRILLAPSRFPPATLNAFLLAAGLIAAGTALRMAFGSMLPADQFILLYPAVVATTLICGVAAGVFSVVLGTLCAWYFPVPPAFSFGMTAQRADALLVFALIASLYVAMIGIIRLALERLRRLNKNLIAVSGTLGAVFEANPDAILVTDGLGRITRANRHAAEMFRLPAGDLIGTPVANLMPHRFRARHRERHAAFMTNPPSEGLRARETSWPAPGGGEELFGLRGDNTEFPIGIHAGPIEGDDNDRTIAIVRDLTMQKAAAEALAESQRTRATVTERARGAEALRVWEDAFKVAAIGIVILDPDLRRYRHANPAFAAMHGLTVEQVEGTGVDGSYPEDARPDLECLRATLDHHGQASVQTRHRRADGSVFPVEVIAATRHGADGTVRYRVASVRDMTEQKQHEEGTERALAEKSLLLNEVHHRVKNNLQIISSLLYLQGDRIDDPIVARVLLASRNRVLSMATISPDVVRVRGVSPTSTSGCSSVRC